LKLFGEVRERTFAKKDISADWRGTGLAPKNPAVVLKWLSAWEKVGVKKGQVLTLHMASNQI